jgi:hypothetical protein
MEAFLRNWNFTRIIRLIASVALLAYGYAIMDWLIIMIGLYLGLMAVFNAGCNPFTRTCNRY